MNKEIETPGIGSVKFNITFSTNWFKQQDILQYSFKERTKNFFIKIVQEYLGIYNTHEVKVLEEPIPNDTMWEYQVQGISTTYYVFFIKIWKGKFKL